MTTWLYEIARCIKTNSLCHFIRAGKVMHLAESFICFGLNIFYSEEKDWVWHTMRKCPLQNICFICFKPSVSFSYAIHHSMKIDSSYYTYRHTVITH